MIRDFIRSISLLALVLMSAGCKSELNQGNEAGVPPMSIAVSSPSFKEGERIPIKFTCDGMNLSPQLDWSGQVATVHSLALIMDDPDAPAGTFVHWVLFNLPGDLASLPEGVSGTGVAGSNGLRKLGYGGPCPPKGSTHRYFFKLYALDSTLDLKEGASNAEVERAMQGHIVGQGQLSGKYSR